MNDTELKVIGILEKMKAELDEVYPQLLGGTEEDYDKFVQNQREKIEANPEFSFFISSVIDPSSECRQFLDNTWNDDPWQPQNDQKFSDLSPFTQRLVILTMQIETKKSLILTKFDDLDDEEKKKQLEEKKKKLEEIETAIANGLFC